MEDFLIVTLSIPLINKSLQVDLYKVNNLPTVHLEHRVQFSHILEGEYIAISALGTHAAISTSYKIHICLATQDQLHVLYTALFPVEKIKWCIYALFVKDGELINMHFWHNNLVLNLDGYIWAVGSLATDCKQICCLEESHLETIVPP